MKTLVLLRSSRMANGVGQFNFLALLLLNLPPFSNSLREANYKRELKKGNLMFIKTKKSMRALIIKKALPNGRTKEILVAL